MIIAVAIAAILLVAGGVWMLSLRPGALRGAVNDFDGALAAARQLAATSGNGATLAFVPRSDGAHGFVLRVYSGRPNAANAVTATNTMAVLSNATVSEATYGSPPFAIFLSSAGYPTGKASYPTVDGSGNATFPIVAKQPACPLGGIVLTFTSPQGISQIRSLRCNVVLTGVAAANPSPTPNPPHIVPQFMLAHWTNDANPLQFKVAEIGYSHWFASSTGVDCQTQGSDNGSAPASFSSGWPYSLPLTPGETSLSPSAPALPYSWPNGNVDDPAASFHMQPSVGGQCTVRIVDDYNQEVDAQVQVMGSLTSDTASLTFSAPTAPAQTITLSKTWDSEPLQLQYGGACGGVVAASKGSISTPGTPGTTAARAQLVVKPLSAGSCSMLVDDQYGEPAVAIPINVKQFAPIKTWPQELILGIGGSAVGKTSGALAIDASNPSSAFASMLNGLLGGGVARAASGSWCFAIGLTTSGVVDSSLTSWVSAATGIYVDTNGCLVDSAGVPLAANVVGMIAYNSSGSSQTYATSSNTCAFVDFGPWAPSATATAASLRAAASGAQSCNVTLSNGGTATPAPDAGLVAVNVQNSSAVTMKYQQTCSGAIKGADASSVCKDRTTASVNTTCTASYQFATDIGGAYENWSRVYNTITYVDPAPTTSAAWTTYLENTANDDSVYQLGVPGSLNSIDVSGCP